MRAYHTPTTVAEALSLLHQHKDKARIIAGGTDLILDVEAEHTATPEVLVDVTKITGIDRIAQEDGWIVLGAGITHTQIEGSPLARPGQMPDRELRRHRRAAGTQCSDAGRECGPRPAGRRRDDRSAGVRGGSRGRRARRARRPAYVAAATLHLCRPRPQPLGPRSDAARVPLSTDRARAGNAFDRIMRPQGVALPVLAIAAKVQLDADLRRVEDAAIAIGPAGPTPFAPATRRRP